MLYLAIKAAPSRVIIALVSEVARKYPGFGALIAGTCSESTRQHIKPRSSFLIRRRPAPPE